MIGGVTSPNLSRLTGPPYLLGCCGILLTPLRWFKQIKRTVSFDVTIRFNAIQQSTAMYNSHIFNVVTQRSTINDQLKHSKYTAQIVSAQF